MATSAAGRAGSIDHFVQVGVAQLFFGPALLQHATETRLHDPLVAHFESGEELDNRFARAVDEASRLAMRNRSVTADEVQRELDDHPNTTEAAAFKERGVGLRV